MGLKPRHSLILFGYFLAVIAIAIDGTAGQRPPYSLQSAVDELHRREAAKYPLNAPPSPQHFFGALGSSSSASSSDLDYWDDDSKYPGNSNYNANAKLLNRHRLNKALSKYLERENYESDRGGLTLGPFGGYEFDEETSNNPFSDEKKRSSFFRERDSKYGGSELTDEFLHEIEEAQERDREQHYKDAIRQIWEKYQPQDNDIASAASNNINSNNNNNNNELFEEKKRMRMPPYYMLMQKKRSYPILPYLPYDDRKKRFPIAKRSAKHHFNDLSTIARNDEQKQKDLNELLVDEKKKRSVEFQTVKPTEGQAENKSSTVGVASSSAAPATKAEEVKKDDNDSSQMAVDTHGNDHKMHAGIHDHPQKEHKHRKRSNHQHSHEHNSREEEYEENDDEEGEEGDDSDHEDDHDDEHESADTDNDNDEADDTDERKKKRDVATANVEIEAVTKPAPHQLKEIPMKRKKKSIQWSKYFGIDRKKKMKNLEMKKRSAFSENDDDSEAEEVFKKHQELDPEKIDAMDKKLQSLEDYIIDDTIKYTGAHEGITSQAEIRRLKDHVLSRLATAYSLEKMRRALDKLRQSVENDNHLNRNIIDTSDAQDMKGDGLENQKRLSVKKEILSNADGATDFQSDQDKVKDIQSNSMMSVASGHNSKHHGRNLDSEDEDRKKMRQRKRNSYLRYPSVPNDIGDLNDDLNMGNYESLNDAYLGNKNYIIGSNQCPIIENMAERCQGVDLLSGDVNQELLAACGVHQICYLCGTSQIACDYQYLAEADNICGNNNECQAAARSVLMILRGTPGTQIGPRECLKNPCLYSAMREIGL